MVFSTSYIYNDKNKQIKLLCIPVDNCLRGWFLFIKRRLKTKFKFLRHNSF